MLVDRRVLATGVFLAAACAHTRPDYLGAPVPAAESTAGCYALTWTRGSKGSYPDTLCLLARQLKTSSIGEFPGQLALDRPLGEPSDANLRRWFGQWWWELKGDSVFVIISNGFSGWVLRGSTT